MRQNGSAKKAWNLLDDGLLWKEVIEDTAKEFETLARTFVGQLQEAVKPADALQGLLLDRIAAAYFRKQLLLGDESAMRRYMIADRKADPQGRTPQARELSVMALSSPTQTVFCSVSLRYELLLDQGLHRDLILLKQLQSAAQDAAALPSKKPPKSANQIEGEVGDSALG